jgi:hypothetical protein
MNHKTNFNCPCCRGTIDLTLIEMSALYIVENRLVESINILASRLQLLQQLDSDMTKDLVTRLLIFNNFQIGRVDDTLFNLVGLASFQTETNELSSGDNQILFFLF